MSPVNPLAEDGEPKPSRGHASWIAAGFGLAIAGGIALGVPILRDALLDARLEAVVTRDRGGRADLPWQAPIEGDPCARAGACPPRALAASGVHMILAAGGPSDPSGARLAEAQRRLEAALAERPANGGWLTWLAYAKALRQGVTPDVLGAFAAGYAATPYLPREGFWRVRFGAINWTRLSDDTRRRVVAEAVWLKAIDPDGADPVLDPAMDPQAAKAITAALARPPAPGALVAHRRSRGPGRVGPVGE